MAINRGYVGCFLICIVLFCFKILLISVKIQNKGGDSSKMVGNWANFYYFQLIEN